MTNCEPEFMTWKRRGAERVRRLVEGMSREEELGILAQTHREDARPPKGEAGRVAAVGYARGAPGVLPCHRQAPPPRRFRQCTSRTRMCHHQTSRRGTRPAPRRGYVKGRRARILAQTHREDARPPKGESVKIPANSRRQPHNLDGHPIRAAITEHFILPVDVFVSTPECLAKQRNNPYSF